MPSPAPRDPATFAAEIEQQFRVGSLPTGFRREVLRALVAGCWGALPPYSTLAAPEVSEVARATVGTGVVPVFRHPESGQWCAVVVRPGTHYQGPRYAADPRCPYFMIAGGFINLSDSVSSHDGVTKRAEHPAEGALRELMEEIVDPSGTPILQPSPDRLVPVDTMTLSLRGGEKRVVIGFLLELNVEETSRILSHVSRTQADAHYRALCRERTINQESGHPEICQVDVQSLGELVRPELNLLHPDQRHLFDRVAWFLRICEGPRSPAGSNGLN